MLIKSTDLLKPAIDDEKVLKAYKSSAKSKHTLAKIGQSLDTVMADFQKDHTFFFPSRGSWSSHNLLEWILQRTGPAKVWITSWTISEPAVRALIRMVNDGLIQEAQCLFDERIRVHCPQAYQLADMTAMNLKLMKIHAKCIVVINDDWGVAVSTSANFTTNRRVESYVLSTELVVANSFKDWIQNELNGARPFENES